MPIAPLPPSTVRAIGSTSAISDPCSLIKELLDNSLDAGASSVVIEISQNTIDVIQVKDNGHGIPSDDHAFICRRTYTSKLQTVEDLRNIGGISLGFRGEALASAAEMSGSLTVFTRVDAETVGSSIKYGGDGAVIGTQRASHPVGTTVRITDFCKHIPVRRQTAVKNASKTMIRIKKMLQTYAMARPERRLSFKILKAKNESNNWMYTPGQGATILNAVLRIAGKEVAANCTLKKWPEVDQFSSDEPKEASSYEFTAFLPKADTDFSNVNNGGQYVVVDGRPVSTSRGIGQNLTKLYKSYLRSSSANNERPTTINDPFLCLHLRCPPGSYDINIEPAKDDILFEDKEKVLSLIDDMFKGVYGELNDTAARRAVSNKRNETASNNNGFELLLARKDATDSSLQPSGTNVPTLNPYSPFKSPFSSNPRRGLRRGHGGPSEASHITVEQQPQESEFVSPWSITKMNTSFRTPDKSKQRFDLIHFSKDNSMSRTKSNNRISEEDQRAPSTTTLPSPSTSNSVSTSPSNSNASPSLFRFSQASPVAPAQSDSRRATRERDRERYGNGALDTWFQRTTQVGLLSNTLEGQSNQSEDDPSLTKLVEGRFGSENRSTSSPNPVQDTPLQDESSDHISDSSPASQSVPQHITSATISPVLEVPERRRELPVLENWASSLNRLSVPTPNTELELALDFERRKKEAIQKRREQMKSRSELPSSTNPHQSRYLAARAVLNSQTNVTQAGNDPLISEQNPSQPKLSPYDPRAYLIRQQSALSKDGNKARRINTNKLPLEKISEGYDLHDVCLRLPADESLLTSSIKCTLIEDLYAKRGADIEAISTTPSEDTLGFWTQRLSMLINGHYTNDEGKPEPEIQFDLSSTSQNVIDHDND